MMKPLLYIFFAFSFCVARPYTQLQETLFIPASVKASTLSVPDSVTPKNDYAILELQNQAMNHLLIWSGLSVAAGAVMIFQPSRVIRDFGIQNLAWGSIDAGIAYFAKNSLDKKRHSVSFSPKKEKRQFKRILLINTGLDILYMIAGYMLIRSNKERLKGHGYGVLTQGAFLFVFDALYALAI